MMLIMRRRRELTPTAIMYLQNGMKGDGRGLKKVLKKGITIDVKKL